MKTIRAKTSGFYSLRNDVRFGQIMRRASTALAACAAVAPLHLAARPVIVEEAARLTSPVETHQFDGAVIDGDDLLAVAFNRAAVPEIFGDFCNAIAGGGDDEGPEVLLFHYERQSDGSWLLRGQIAAASAHYPLYWRLALKNGVGVFAGFQAQTLERTSTGWNITPLSLSRSVSDIAIRGQEIAVGSENGANAVVHFLEKQMGQWVIARTVQGAPGFNDDEWVGPDIELATNELTAGNESETSDLFLEPVTFVFDRMNGVWTQTASLDGLFQTIVVDDKIGLGLNSWIEPGDIASFYTRPQPGAEFTDRYTLLTDEWFADKQPGPVVIQENLAFAGAAADDQRGRDAGSVTVLRRGAAGERRFHHQATLLASDATPNAGLGRTLDVSGTRAAALGCLPPASDGTGRSAIYVYELPDPPPPVGRQQDTFEDMNSAGWTPWGLTNWRVVASGGSQVFRNTNTQGDARAIFDGAPVGPNQTIQADLKVNAFASGASSRWVGLMVRYTDPGNFYYLMHGTSTLQIRKIVNGAFGPIASTPFTFQVGRNYRFRLEAVGTWIRAYVDDRLMLTVRDTSLSEGRTGLAMWKANAEYDNVVVSSNPYTTLHADSFFRQPSTAGDARIVLGAPTEDQILTATIRPRTFHASGGWAGLMARYVDDSTYYYVLLTSSGKASLRRWMSGRITVLDEVPFTVTAGATYRVRLEAIGDSLRLYVNGKLLAEAEDGAIPSGRYGLVTYRAAADFDSFIASRP